MRVHLGVLLPGFAMDRALCDNHGRHGQQPHNCSGDAGGNIDDGPIASISGKQQPTTPSRLRHRQEPTSSCASYAQQRDHQLIVVPLPQIAVLKEVDAKGSFSSLVMAVVVLKDVLVIVAFALNIDIIVVVSSHPGWSYAARAAQHSSTTNCESMGAWYLISSCKTCYTINI